MLPRSDKKFIILPQNFNSLGLMRSPFLFETGSIANYELFLFSINFRKVNPLAGRAAGGIHVKWQST
jgi:hypothetical protein